MKKETAIKICSNWYGGQWSAMYQFLSSGVYMVENHLRYLQEIETCLHPEYNLHPSFLSKKDTNNLQRLREFFIKLGKLSGIDTEYKKHSVYGYEIPVINMQLTGNEIVSKVQKITYPI